MTKKEDFVSFMFSIALRKLGTKKLKSVIWRNHCSNLKILVNQNILAHGVIFVSPITCFALGVLDSQIVRLNVSFITSIGEVKNIERLMKIRVCFTVKPDQLILSKSDLFNIIRGYAFSSLTVEGLIPSFVLRNEPIPVVESAKLSRIPEADVANNIRISQDHLTPILQTSGIYYKNDVVQLTDHNIADSITTNLYYKIDVSSSPCIIDSSCSIYESSSIPSLLPYSNFQLKCAISDPMKKTVSKMSQIYFGQRKVNTKPLTFLITGASGSGKRLCAHLFASITHRNIFEIDAYSLAMENQSQTEGKLDGILEKANGMRHCIIYIFNSHVIAFDPSNTVDRRIVTYIEEKLEEDSKVTIIFSCVTDKLSLMHSSVRALALFSFVIDYMNETDREVWLSYFLTNNEKLVQHVAKKTSGFTLAEMEELLKNVGLRMEDEKLKNYTYGVFDAAVDERNSNFADAIGAPKIPNVRWTDIGGLEETKRNVIESIRTNLFGNRSLKRSGIILHGAPGCGKTLIAKAVATEFNIAFLSIKGPELLNKYVGQSEENLRKVFERAKLASPCIIFFDEIDSLAPNRGKNGDSGGVIDRIVSQLLAELDKLHNSPRLKVFVMGATNRPDLLDSSLITPGRFDKLIEVSPGKDIDSKTKILEAISRKMNFDKDVKLDEIASIVDDSMSGAQLFSIISNAAMQAIIERINLIENHDKNISDDDDVRVAQRHLIESVKKFHSNK